ncbi:hypothetical protein GQ600_24871 [Phytophthora cactorum]|nr:hypothetical protein GQ600_24871 [Phytophthora cactorum]
MNKPSIDKHMHSLRQRQSTSQCIFHHDGKATQRPQPTPSKTVATRASNRATRNLDSPTTSLTPVAEKSPEPLTPYQRMQEILSAKAAVEEHGPIVVATVEGLKTHLQGKNQTTRIRIRMKLLWTSDHTYGQWQLIWMHFVDARAPEPLEKMLRVSVSDPYEANRQDIDSILLTATLWNLESGSELLPRPGTVVNIDEYSNLQLYRDSQCQLTTRLSELNWERSDM